MKLNHHSLQTELFPGDEQQKTKTCENKSQQPADGASASNEQTETKPSKNKLQQTVDGTSLEAEETESRPCENELPQTADGASPKNERERKYHLKTNQHSLQTKLNSQRQGNLKQIATI